MKIKKTSHGIELYAESKHDAECLKLIANHQLSAKFSDDWEQTGYLSLTFKPHPWGEN